MAHVRWQRAAPDSSAVMNGILAGATGALSAQRDNEARDFQYGEQRRQEGRAERMGVAKEQRHLQDQKSLAEFNAALKRENESAGAGYKRQARTMEVAQLRQSMGDKWSPDHDMAAEIYRLTGDHGALKQIFTPQDPAKVEGQKLLNQGRELGNQYTQLRMDTLEGKNAREADLAGTLREGVDDTTREDLLNQQDEYFNDTGEGGGPSRGQYEEDVRTSLANLQGGRAAATAGKPFSPARSRVVREPHAANPATEQRLNDAEARREEQLAVTDLRAHAKDLEKQLNKLDETDPQYAVINDELSQVRSELGRRARSHLQGAKPATAPAAAPAGGAGSVDYKAKALEALRSMR